MIVIINLLHEEKTIAIQKTGYRFYSSCNFFLLAQQINSMQNNCEFKLCH